MSIAELKLAVDQLPVEGRLELAEHIGRRIRKDDPGMDVEIGRRLDEIRFLAGIRIAREQASRKEGVRAEDARQVVNTKNIR